LCDRSPTHCSSCDFASASPAPSRAANGAAIIALNHKSFLDSFFVGIATRRQVRYMAKTELFKRPLAWLFSRLGAFPVRRGEADQEAIRRRGPSWTRAACS
jgi:1-acyl-sn-glycerol-3-phosphate acyltransferase